MHVRLTRKLALSLNGLDLSHMHVGDVVLLPDETGAMVIREGWAEPVSPSSTSDDRSSLRKRPPDH